MGRVYVRQGNILEGGADLTVLPCSAKGSVSPWTEAHIRLLGLLRPGKMDLGSTSTPQVCQCSSPPAGSIVFGASVLDGESSPETIEAIAKNVGTLAMHDRTIKNIEVPLLGTGAGQLTSDASAIALKRGFMSTSPFDATLRIFVSDTERSRRLADLLDAMDQPVPKKRSQPPPGRKPKESRATELKLLFLGANPLDEARLQLDEEIREISAALDRARHGKLFTIAQHWAVRPRELTSHMLKYRPKVVHFSGHGSEVAGLCFHGDNGDSAPVSAEALKSLFGSFSKTVELVVLNACFSLEQARAISQFVPAVVGVPRQIADGAASRFSAGFYEALASGERLGEALQIGQAQILLHGGSESDFPVLESRKKLAPNFRLVQSYA